MEPIGPMATAHLFAELHARLLALLEELTPEEWQRPTSNPGWTVKDVAAHLLDTDLRRLSFQRDRYTPPPPAVPIDSPQGLLAYLNQLNADWVRAAARLSPRLLIALLAHTGTEVAKLFRSLDPHGEAIFPVAWAGEERSENWLDVAREYTEKWLHQQQIREAAGRPLLTDRDHLFPLLHALVRSLPFTYQGTPAPTGTVVTLVVEGEAGGVWSLRRDAGGWRLYTGAPEAGATAEVRMDQDVAWRFFASRRHKPELLPRVAFTGDLELARVMAGATSVMA